MKFQTLCCAAVVSVAQQAHADEWVYGLGGSDLLDKVREESLAVLIEYHSKPFWSGSRVDLSWLGLEVLN